MVLYYSWWDESTTTDRWRGRLLISSPLLNSLLNHGHLKSRMLRNGLFLISQSDCIAMYRALTFCLQDALSFACITRGGGGTGYWSYLLIPLRLWKGKLQISTFRGNIEVFTLGKKKSQVAFIPGGKGSLIPVHNFTESCYR